MDYLLYQGISEQYLSLHLCGLGQLPSQVCLAQFLSYVIQPVDLTVLLGRLENKHK